MVAKAVSTWSLHRTLGRPEGEGEDVASVPSTVPGALSLLELPAALRARGYDAVQILYPHLESRDPGYLAELRAALDASNMTLEAMLIGAGDLTGSDADAAEARIDEWLDISAALGATRARTAAGKAAPTPETIRASATRLRRLAERHPEVRLVTENWWGLLPNADAVLALLEATSDAVGFLIDLDNWSGPDKYEELARVAPLAETCHAKCRFTAAGPDADDFRRSLGVLKDAGYDGPLALIYDGPDDDEWGCLDVEYGIVTDVFGA